MRRSFFSLNVAQSLRSWFSWNKRVSGSRNDTAGENSEDKYFVSRTVNYSSSSAVAAVPSPEAVVLKRIQNYYERHSRGSLASAPFTSTAPLDYAEAVVRARRTFRQYDPSRSLPQAVLKRVLEATMRAPTAFNLQGWTMVVIQSPEQKKALGKAALSQRHVLDAPTTIVFAGDTEPERNAPLALEMSLDSNTIPPTYAPGYLRNVYYFLHGGTFQAFGALKSILSMAYTAQTGTPLLSVPVNKTGYAWKQSMIPLTTFVYLATAAGWETCVLEGIDQNEVRKVAGLPDRFTVPAIVTVGYPLPASDLGNDSNLSAVNTLSPSAPLSTRFDHSHFIHWERY